LNKELGDKVCNTRTPNRLYWWGWELIELVAEYGGLLYGQHKGVEYKQFSEGMISDDIPGMNAQLYLIVSQRGYERADQAIKKHGNSLLPRLARMTIEESEKLGRILPITFYERKIIPLIDRMRR
ncbi:MAG: hypothetical protein AABW52_06470, partial [Nanoarchaeota archaeon]